MGMAEVLKGVWWNSCNCSIQSCLYERWCVNPLWLQPPFLLCFSLISVYSISYRDCLSISVSRSTGYWCVLGICKLYLPTLAISWKDWTWSWNKLHHRTLGLTAIIRWRSWTQMFPTFNGLIMLWICNPYSHFYVSSVHSHISCCWIGKFNSIQSFLLNGWLCLFTLV